MQIPLYQVDAFASKIFAGNPAAVCPLQEWTDDWTLQAIAAENNLSETAFFVDKGDFFELRWFTPATEVDLCGHATLASAFVICTELEPERDQVKFHTQSGLLTVTRAEDGLSMEFPAWAPEQVHPPTDLIEGLGGSPLEVLAARDYLVVYENEQEVRELRPSFERLGEVVDRFGIIVTAPGKDYDCVSRFFAPARGVHEDPVTGSAHCTLVPYWAERLGKSRIRAFQASKRSGILDCEMMGDQVLISGSCALYLRGTIEI